MNILVTNDDGINSPGLWALTKALSKVGNVLVVAPDTQRSGAGTSVSMARGIMDIHESVSEIPGVPSYAIPGTPCDCVFWALRKMRQERISLIVSGINMGPNTGFDIPFSGTVSATVAGYSLGIPSIAVSLVTRSYKEEMNFKVAADIVGRLASDINQGIVQTRIVLNVNVPNVPAEQIKGILVTQSARVWFVNLLGSGATKETAPEKFRFEEGTDVWAVNEGYVSITPLRFDLTHYDLLPEISRYVNNLNHPYLKNDL